MGGWPADSLNKFTAEGRSADENDIYNFIKSVSNLRKTNEALSIGKTVQFIPQDGLYVYFRESGENLVMVAANTSKETRKIKKATYAEMLNDKSSFRNINGKDVKIEDEMEIAPFEILIFEVR